MSLSLTASGSATAMRALELGALANDGSVEVALFQAAAERAFQQVYDKERMTHNFDLAYPQDRRRGGKYENDTSDKISDESTNFGKIPSRESVSGYEKGLMAAKSFYEKQLQRTSQSSAFSKVQFEEEMDNKKRMVAGGTSPWNDVEFFRPAQRNITDKFKDDFRNNILGGSDKKDSSSPVVLDKIIELLERMQKKIDRHESSFFELRSAIRQVESNTTPRGLTL